MDVLQVRFDLSSEHSDLVKAPRLLSVTQASQSHRFHDSYAAAHLDILEVTKMSEV